MEAAFITYYDNSYYLWFDNSVYEVGKTSIKKCGSDSYQSDFEEGSFWLGIGLFMTSVQPLLVLILGHYTITFNSSISFQTIFFYLTLYVLVAIREELAFRGYPLFTLNYRF